MIKRVSINEGEVLRIEDGRYYILNDEEPGYECMTEVSRDKFIEAIGKYAYVCLTSWDAKLKQDYLDLVEYCNEIEQEISYTKYDEPKSGISITGSKVSIIGERVVMLGDGRIVDQYVYNIDGYTAKNGKPFASLKANIIVRD